MKKIINLDNFDFIGLEDGVLFIDKLYKSLFSNKN